VVDDKGVIADDGIPRAWHGKVGLRPGRVVVDKQEQLRIQTCQSGKFIGLGAAAIMKEVVDSLVNVDRL